MPFGSPLRPLLPARRTRHNLAILCAGAFALATAVACGSSTAPPIPTVDVAVLTINGGGFLVERGYHVTLTTTARNKLGVVVTVPVVWRSNNEKIVAIDGSGRLAALDTGTTTIFASSLGTNSQPVQVIVRWAAAAKIDTFRFTPPTAVTPGATPDSVRALVSDLNGRPVNNARVAFAVTGGGGTISPAIATTGTNGVASAEWKLGPVAGTNTATATVLGEDDKPFGFVTPNVTSFAIRTFNALELAAGDAQTGLILGALAINPAVRVVDSTGKPRVGVPVTFAPTGGGRVASTVVSTGADGVASPGAWTLGDLPGEQTLVAKVQFASLTLRATATGTPVHYTPASITAGTFATCGIAIEGPASCWGEQPKVGDGTTTNRPLPTLVKSTDKYLFIGASPSVQGHFCGVAIDQSISCWGVNALNDTLGRGLVATVPTRIVSTKAFTLVAPGALHSCALGSDQAVYCWGDNSVGQLGDRTQKAHLTPTEVYGGFKFTAVTSGAGHSCGLTPEGSVLCWGFNQSGQLGDGTTTSWTSPTAVSGALTFKSIAAGESFTCGLTTLDRPYCWGNLGTGSTIVNTPRAYPTAPAFTSIALGGGHACALTSDGTPYCWGSNGFGQVGDSTFTDRPNPTAVSTALRFKSISAGYLHNCAMTQDNSVACWGLNRAGELGDSATTVPNRPTPRFIVLSVKP